MHVRDHVGTASVGAFVASILAAITGCGGSGGAGFGSGGDGGPTHDGTVTRGDATDSSAATRDGAHEGATAPTDAASADVGTPHDGAPSGDAGRDSPAGPRDSGPPEAARPNDANTLQFPVVYGQSASVLYSVDPDSKAVTKVGVFTGCSDVIDIALDKDSNMYATTFQGVYTVDANTAACTLLSRGTTYPNSLSFVPAGTVDPSVEALVGYQGSAYVRIDTTSGAISHIGSLGSMYTSSGDIVSVIGGGTYLTVTGSPDCSDADCLVEVNPTTGALIKNFGSVQHSAVYGLAFWAGNLYGFDMAGQLFEVTFPDAGGLGIMAIPIPDRPVGLSFNGAGSTTAAPRR